MTVQNARLALMKTAVRKPSPAERLLTEILERWTLQAPDGRPLYRYQVSDAHYLRAREIIADYSACLGKDNPNLCALFILVTAEWYRRAAQSLSRQWSDIGLLPDDIATDDRSEIARTGLKWWALPLKVWSYDVGKRRQFLFSIALNGGLPSSLVVGARANRVRRFFEGVMGFGLDAGGQVPVGDLARFAAAHADDLPRTYRDPVIFDLTAELIAGLVALRRTLPREHRQINPAGWLDHHAPGWRDRLPLYLPDDETACNRLFNTLLAVEPRPRGSSVGLTRMLGRDAAGAWQPGFVVHADGALALDGLAGETEGRFRAFFTGTAARLMSREFAHLYRSDTQKDGTFEITAQAVGRPGFIGPVSFSDPIQATLIRDGHSGLTFPWPQGQARPGACHVLKPTGSERWLDLVGTGSVRSPLPVLCVWVSRRTQVVAHDATVVTRLWQDGAHALWQVEGTAIVELPTGERYRVQTGAPEEDVRRLEVDAAFLPDVVLEDPDVLPVVAPFRPRSQGGRATETGVQLLQNGRRLATALSGLVTAEWKDADGFLIDRVRVFVIPSELEVRGTITATGARIDWTAPPGWHLVPIDEDGSGIDDVERTAGGLLCPWRMGPERQLRLRLVSPDGSALLFALHLHADRTRLVDADGTIRDDRNERVELAPSELRGATLITSGSERLDLGLRGAGQFTSLFRRVDGEIPMTRFLDLAENLLGLARERGAALFLRDERGRTICTIRRSQERPQIDDRQVTFSRGPGPVEIAVARPLLGGAREHALETRDGRIHQIPDRLTGPCLVYRRQGDAVTTRPEIASLPVDPARPFECERLDPLVLIRDERERRHAFRETLRELALDPSAGAEVSDLIKVIHSLRGLSPRALDLTRELPEAPAMLCRLLLSASHERREDILGLERNLPFLWMALPVAVWREVVGVEVDRICRDLAPILGADAAMAQAAISMRQQLVALTERTFWFAGIRAALDGTSPPPGSLHALAQAHVVVHAETQVALSGATVEAAIRLKLPPEIRGLDFGSSRTLVAPHLLACVAAGRLPMSPPLAAGLRDALDIDPVYVASAFPHCLSSLLR